jgi:hypothetical protein
MRCLRKGCTRTALANSNYCAVHNPRFGKSRSMARRRFAKIAAAKKAKVFAKKKAIKRRRLIR